MQPLEAGKGQETDSALESSERKADTLIIVQRDHFRFLSRTVRKQICVVTKCMVICNNSNRKLTVSHQKAV